MPRCIITGILGLLLTACAPLAADQPAGEQAKPAVVEAPRPADAAPLPPPPAQPQPAAEPAPAPVRRGAPVVGERDGNWTLVWSDEFDRSPCPDPANWTFEQGFMRNEELQWYRRQNAFCRSGLLVLEARRERLPNPDFVAGSSDWRRNRAFAEYTSASVTTAGKQEWLYGRIDVRARFDTAYGLWPAIWLLGGNWHKSHGEIDIMESFGGRLGIAIHWPGGSRSRSIDTVRARDPVWAGRFPVWRMDWTPQRIEIFLDGKSVGSFDTGGIADATGANPFQQPHHLILNLAIGAAGGDPAGAPFPARMEVDYVRVYRAAEAGD